MAHVVIQAGHCFRTAGSTGTRAASGRPTEQQVAWDVSQRAAAILTRHGHTPTVIVADPDKRTAYRGDCFVAVHCDGSTSPAAKGASVGYRTAQGQALAHAWKQAYARRGWVGFRADNYTAALQGYYGTRRAIEQGNRAACIIEAGFLTNPGDAAQLSSSDGRERVALAIADAVNALHPPTRRPKDDFDMTPEEREQLLDDIASAVQHRLLVEDTRWLDWRIAGQSIDLRASIYAARDTVAALVRRITGTKAVKDGKQQHELDTATGAAIQASVAPKT